MQKFLFHQNLAKACKKTYFDQHLECTAPKCWLKFTTPTHYKVPNKQTPPAPNIEIFYNCAILHEKYKSDRCNSHNTSKLSVCIGSESNSLKKPNSTN